MFFGRRFLYRGNNSPGRGSVGGSSTFSPKNISSLHIWHRADGVTLVNGEVSAWLDKSGNSRNSTQAASGSRPQYSLADSAFNNKPIVQFVSDGSTFDYLDMVALNTLTAAEAFVVFNLANDPPGAAARSGFWEIGTTTSTTNFPFTDGIIYDGFATNARKTTVNPTPSLTGAHIYNAISVSGEWTSNLDNVQLFTTGSNTVGLLAAPKLGAKNASSTGCDGKWAEFILYSRKLTAAERNKVVSYLTNRYKIGI